MGRRDLPRRIETVRGDGAARTGKGFVTALLERRLLAQQLARPAFAEPRDVVGWLGAVQAQDYAGAKWAVGLRLSEHIAETAMERAIGDGTILRMHLMRWTWQLVLPQDVRWMLALIAPRLVARAARRHRELDLDAATFRKSNRVLERALRDGRHWTRDELAALLDQAGISPAKERLSHLLGRAEIDAILSSGARRGKQFTYAHLDHRVPSQRTPLPREEALAELARRYFQSRGPALLADFMWWSGLSASDARAGLEAIRSSLVSEVRGSDTYFRAELPPRVAQHKDACHLLPAFDEYLVAYRKRDGLFDPDHAKRLNAGGGMLNPSVILDGRVIGTWRRELARADVAIAMDLFQTPTPKEQRAIARAAKRFGSFLGVEARMAPARR
jgi:hypothetical protein